MKRGERRSGSKSHYQKGEVPALHKLLIVDDEYLMRESLKIIFKEQENISVIEEADSASLSLEKFVAIRPDIVIMDAAIPGADVADLVKYMKGINKYLV